MSRISMTEQERDAFLAEERTVRIAVVDGDGYPHVTPVWFVWDGADVWVYNLDGAHRTAALEAGTKVGLVVDAGSTYQELRGVTLRIDRYEFRADEDTPDTVRRAFGRKYAGVDQPIDGADDHTWLRLVPQRTASWDFRKI